MSVLVVVLDVGAALEQRAHALLVAAGARVHERRVAGPRHGVDVGVVRDQQSHDVHVARARRLHQRGAVTLHGRGTCNHSRTLYYTATVTTVAQIAYLDAAVLYAGVHG